MKPLLIPFIAQLLIFSACVSPQQPADAANTEINTEEIEIPLVKATNQSTVVAVEQRSNESTDAKAESVPQQASIPTERLEKAPPKVMETADTKPEPTNMDEVSPKIPLSEKTPQEALAATFSHANWNELVAKYVRANGKVNYKGFKADKAKLQVYLDLLNEHGPQSSWSRDKKLAFWINAYNAYTVKLIVDNYPLSSIMKLNNGKAWDQAFAKVGGKTYTLNNIEHDIIRKQFNEPRIHFAVNCASISCPKLLNEAYTEEKLNGQLERQTRAYINNPTENSISAEKLVLSSLFDWYKGDFTKSGSLVDFINKYSTTKAQQNASISHKEYNWMLNE